MRKILSVFLTVALMAAFSAPAFAADKETIDKAIADTAAYMLKTVKTPVVDSVGGEWAVIGLARSGCDVPDSYFENYRKAVEKHVNDRGGILHDRKYTENSRVILALTAAGYDPLDVAGYNLTAPLEDFDNTVWQGINGSVFALIALDSNDYPSSRRDDYIAEILRKQLPDGGWNLAEGTAGSTKDRAADPDVTGMALQALAKYQSRQEVKAATEKALAFLSGAQEKDAGYSSWGSTNVESSVQVLVALCELGIPADDVRFVKNGKTVVDNILSYKNADGSFGHTADGTGSDQMSTEQALYGLVAVQRALEGKNSLYRMSDAPFRGRLEQTSAEPGLPGRNADVKAMPVVLQGKTFSDIQGHANQKAIEELAARAVVNGKSDASFDPDATMTRAEYAAIITRSLGLAAKGAGVFEDVDSSAWYAGYVGTAFAYGIVTGTSAKTFNPGGTITRQEAAAMTVRAAKLCGMDTSLEAAAVRDALAQFGDYLTVSDWAREPLAFCYREKILADDGMDILPAAAIKRCEIAQMLYSMLGKAGLLQMEEQTK
ncbi:MAG: S-layer homology domain-containing protein [Clostridiales bacterium]|nr:S-layer homology domain-containing protein [Clostridiales bacterium]